MQRWTVLKLVVSMNELLPSMQRPEWGVWPEGYVVIQDVAFLDSSGSRSLWFTMASAWRPSIALYPGDCSFTKRWVVMALFFLCPLWHSSSCASPSPLLYLLVCSKGDILMPFLLPVHSAARSMAPKEKTLQSLLKILLENTETLHSSAADVSVAFQIKCSFYFRHCCVITSVSYRPAVEINCVSVCSLTWKQTTRLIWSRSEEFFFFLLFIWQVHLKIYNIQKM